MTANVGAALKVEMTFIEAHLNALTSEPSHVYIEGFFIPEKMPIGNTRTKLVVKLYAPKLF